MFVYNQNMEITHFNSAAERITQRKKEDVLGKKCVVIFDESLCLNNCELCMTVKKEENEKIDFRSPFMRQDGVQRIGEFQAGQLSLTSEDNIHVMVSLTDITELTRLREELKTTHSFRNLIGKSAAMRDLFQSIRNVSGYDSTVCLFGESGTGKELVARAVHYESPRADKPLVKVNCSSLSDSLLESELFGHVKGAFTGAVKDKIGRFEAADGGTLFLDEVGTLDPQLQVKLLRVLQEREFERVGDHTTVKTDVRIIAATNLDLEEESRTGTFRDDLYYRLSVVSIHLPPLRSRREDIPMLIDHFLKRFNDENARAVKKISRDVMAVLLRYPWPGNVRELENAVERAVVMSIGDEMSMELLPLQVRLFAEQTRSDTADETVEALCAKLAGHAIKQLQVYDGQVYDLVIHEIERQLLHESLVHCNGVKLRAAEFLGINRNTLNKKVKDLGVSVS